MPIKCWQGFLALVFLLTTRKPTVSAGDLKCVNPHKRVELPLVSVYKHTIESNSQTGKHT